MPIPCTRTARRSFATSSTRCSSGWRRSRYRPIAAVQGACLGTGLGLALACDIVYAADDARIGSPFARIGAVLDSGAHAAFVSRVGPHRALELVYTGRLLSGREAEQWGLVNRSVAGADLLRRTRELAASIARGPTAAFLEVQATRAHHRR